MIAADVVEVHVNAIRRSRPQLVDDRTGPVVERRVETKVVEQVPDLVVRTGAADDAVTAELGDLDREAANRPRAAEIQTMSPSRRAAASMSPAYAVTPIAPSGPR